ncbi:MAG: MATE family efflux transporter, partial [Fibrobacterota bacterium]
MISRTVKKTLDGEGGLKEIIRVALPLIASTASHTVLTFTDRVFLSQYSPLALAACVPASVLAFNLICFFMGTGEYTATIISHMHGAKLDRKIGRALWQGIIFSGISF